MRRDGTGFGFFESTPPRSLPPAIMIDSWRPQTSTAASFSTEKWGVHKLPGTGEVPQVPFSLRAVGPRSSKRPPKSRKKTGGGPLAKGRKNGKRGKGNAKNPKASGGRKTETAAEREARRARRLAKHPPCFPALKTGQENPGTGGEGRHAKETGYENFTPRPRNRGMFARRKLPAVSSPAPPA